MAGVETSINCFARTLLRLPDSCCDAPTTAIISTIAEELVKLSTAFWQLNNAIYTDPTQYADAFKYDETETMAELDLLLAEIHDCYESLRVTNFSVPNEAWFFKEGRVTRLLQRLEALRGTILIMRTVSWRGKEYDKSG